MEQFENYRERLPRCGVCRFYKAADECGDTVCGNGLCRRYPPTHEGWPTVQALDACGEWQAADWATVRDFVPVEWRIHAIDKLKSEMQKIQSQTTRAHRAGRRVPIAGKTEEITK